MIETVRHVLDRHVRSGAIAGAVTLVARGDAVTVATAGVQDLETGAPMQRDTIFRIMSMTKPITAAAAMALAEDGRIGLHDSVERFLPELANRRVLRTPDSGLDDTVPAERAITLEDLLTLRLGLGWLHAGPLAARMAELRVAPGPEPVPWTPDEYMARIAQLPLAAQPGTRWIYHTGADILCVLLARIDGVPLEQVLHRRLFAKLGMADTGFFVPPGEIGRLATAYRTGPDGRLAVADPAAGGDYSAPPMFPSELVATADDYLRFARMLLAGGADVLAPASVRAMMTDHVTQAQRRVSPFFPGFWDRLGWGYGGAVVTTAEPGAPAPGSYGWDGGFGTNVTIDPIADIVIVVLMQRAMTGPDDSQVAADVRRAIYADIHQGANA